MNFLSALALDLGRKRIGLAGCDGTGLIATPLPTLIRTTFPADLQHLRQIVAKRRVQVLVAGLPYTLSGQLGCQAAKVQRLARSIAQALDLPLEYVDERLTSVAAAESLRGRGLSPSHHRHLIDQQAARIILQEWLDRRRALSPCSAMIKPISTGEASPVATELLD